jgi:tRNA(Arg) A34 adenosine deaminase TadA
MKTSVASVLSICAGLALLPNCKPQGAGGSAVKQQAGNGTAPSRTQPQVSQKGGDGQPDDVKFSLVPTDKGFPGDVMPCNGERPITPCLSEAEQQPIDFSDVKQLNEFLDKHPFVPATAFEEMDHIYGLMALAVVDADFQEKSDGCPDGVEAKLCTRGHNIGGIMINHHFEVENFERNSNNAMCSGTQHGEVRLMQKELFKTAATTLDTFQIYTSLEPCMMCSGMMMQQNLLRTVYMQSDDGFGKNLERLLIDTRPEVINAQVSFGLDRDEGRLGDGFPPGPRGVISSLGRGPFRMALDRAWRQETIGDGKQAIAGTGSLTEFLKGPAAKAIYHAARVKFLDYKLTFDGGAVACPAKGQVPKECAAATFTSPATPGSKGLQRRVTTLRARMSNAALYRRAVRYFLDPSTGVIPLKPSGNGFEEDTKNTLATMILDAGSGNAIDALAKQRLDNDDQLAKANIAKPMIVSGKIRLVPARDQGGKVTGAIDVITSPDNEVVVGGVRKHLALHDFTQVRVRRLACARNPGTSPHDDALPPDPDDLDANIPDDHDAAPVVEAPSTADPNAIGVR